MGENLTPRQREILEMLANGYSMQQAALKLGIRYKTLTNHCYDAYKRLRLKRPCAVTAIIQAVRTGQITLG